MPVRLALTETVYDDVILYLETLQFPADYTIKQKNKLQRLARNFIVKNHLLYKQSKHGQPKQVILDWDEQELILHSLHAENLGGHLGIDAVFNKIKE